MQAKRLDWETLKLWAELEVVCLKYLDQSGCCCESDTDYGYSKRGEQKQVRQWRRRGRRLNIFGVWQPKKRFDYALMVPTLKAQTLVRLLDWQALIAQQHFQATGQLTVIVLDSASVHQTRIAKQHYERWQQQGLLLFFLPPYSPQMNRIKDEWLHLKRDKLSSQVFDDEFDLAMAIIEGIETRGKRGGYPVERFKFN